MIVQSSGTEVSLLLLLDPSGRYRPIPVALIINMRTYMRRETMISDRTQKVTPTATIVGAFVGAAGLTVL